MVSREHPKPQSRCLKHGRDSEAASALRCRTESGHHSYSGIPCKTKSSEASPQTDESCCGPRPPFLAGAMASGRPISRSPAGARAAKALAGVAAGRFCRRCSWRACSDARTAARTRDRFLLRPPWRGRLARVAQCRLTLAIAGFRAHGWVRQLSAISGLLRCTSGACTWAPPLWGWRC
jgi:hypothetical protein